MCFAATGPRYPQSEETELRLKMRPTEALEPPTSYKIQSFCVLPGNRSDKVYSQH